MIRHESPEVVSVLLSSRGLDYTYIHTAGTVLKWMLKCPLIQTCRGHRRGEKDQCRANEWRKTTVYDVFVPVKTFRLKSMFNKVKKHDTRYDYYRVSAVVDLCWVGGAKVTDGDFTLWYKENR